MKRQEPKEKKQEAKDEKAGDKRRKGRKQKTKRQETKGEKIGDKRRKGRRQKTKRQSLPCHYSPLTTPKSCNGKATLPLSDAKTTLSLLHAQLVEVATAVA